MPNASDTPRCVTLPIPFIDMSGTRPLLAYPLYDWSIHERESARRAMCTPSLRDKIVRVWVHNGSLYVRLKAKTRQPNSKRYVTELQTTITGVVNPLLNGPSPQRSRPGPRRPHKSIIKRRPVGVLS